MTSRRRFEEIDPGRRRFVEAGIAADPPPSRVEPAAKRTRGIFTNDGEDESEEPKDKATPSTPSSNPQFRNLSSHKSVAELIGYVKPVKDPSKLRLCEHFLKNDCMWGDKCRFSHDADEVRAGMPATEGMNFSNLDLGLVYSDVAVPKTQLRYFMSEDARQLIVKHSGVSKVSWHSDASKATLSGTALQVELAEQLIKRVATHCNWGVSEAKVLRLLSHQSCSGARLVLAPMTPSLKQLTVNFSEAKTEISIGSDVGNDLPVKGALVSRVHAVIEFVASKGSLYVIDQSTNGTFLNGVKLPARAGGKVVVFHGDELLFPVPGVAIQSGEFGYMINIDYF